MARGGWGWVGVGWAKGAARRASSRSAGIRCLEGTSSDADSSACAAYLRAESEADEAGLETPTLPAAIWTGPGTLGMPATACTGPGTPGTARGAPVHRDLVLVHLLLLRLRA